MPVAFGFSAGDFIATLNLINTTIEAVNSSRGSSATYRGLIRELYVLESALLRVKNLKLGESQESDKRALEQAASQCQHAIDDFFTKIQAYQPHLRAEGCAGSSWARAKETWMKTKWALCKEEDVEKFKADLRGHSASIQLLLHTVEIKMATIQAQKEDQQRRTLVENFNNTSAALLSRISSLSSSIFSSIQQGKEHLEITTNILRTNFQVFNMVLDIHKFISKLPPQIQRDQPVYLVDAFGRSSPFHLEFIRSAEGLLAVLRVNFEAAGAGTEKIDRRQFVLEDAQTRREIDITKRWESCFRPGQRVTMSVVFENSSQEIINVCPYCRTEHEACPDLEVECAVCHMIFQRISELPEDATLVQYRLHDSDGPENNVPFSESWLSTFDTEPVKDSTTNDIEEISLFRRVRIMPGRKEAHKCKLWALWDHSSGTMTLEGIGNIRIRAVKGDPYLELIGDEENETLNEMLLFESLLGGQCSFQRMDSQRVVVSGFLVHPVYASKVPLAHALDFKDDDWYATIWDALPEDPNPQSRIPDHLWHNYSQAKRPRGGYGYRRLPFLFPGGSRTFIDPNTSTSAPDSGFYN